MIIDCISDLHGFYPELPGGDLLIVAGDLVRRSEYGDYFDFTEWLSLQEYRKIVVVGGNHDTFLEHGIPRNLYLRMEQSFTYLCDSGTEFEGLKIWGSPWTHLFDGQNLKSMAFGKDTEEEMAEKFEKIPDDTDILITHSPPFNILDSCTRRTGKRLHTFHFGSMALLFALNRIKPQLHVFGHLHQDGGRLHVLHYEDKDTWCVNAAIMDDLYDPIHKPVRIIL